MLVTHTPTYIITPYESLLRRRKDMRRNKKKGFTVVELVITVAVIGILTAILVPTFVNLNKKAQMTSMQSFVTNINKQLAINASVDGKNQTMYDAHQDAKEIGFDIEKITPYDDHDILWDSESDRFALVKGDEVVLKDASSNIDLSDAGKLKLFKVAKNAGDISDKYSNYLVESDNWQSALQSVTFSTGVDVGSNENINQITFESNNVDSGAKIRTNGGTLTITAPSDTVRHYGNASVLVINSINTSSYHEFGTVDNAQIKTGHIVIENSDASIDNLLLIAKDDKSGFDDIIVETKQGAELPDMDRTDVNISENGTKVLNVVTPESDEYIYLTRAGIYEQIVVTTEEVDNVTTYESAVPASETSDKTQTVAEQIANVGKKNDEGQYVDSDGNPIAVENIDSVTDIVVDVKADPEAVSEAANDYAGGAGTEKTPYLITNSTELSNIRKALNASYRFAKDIDMTGVSDWESIGTSSAPFRGKIDGNEYSIKNWNTTKSLLGVVRGTSNAKLADATLSNIIDDDYNLIESNVSEDNYSSVLKNLSFKKCIIHINEGDFGVIADAAIYSYIYNCDFSECEVDFGPSYRTGIMFGSLYSCHAKGLHLAEDNTIYNSSSIDDYWGNNGLLIGGVRFFEKPYQNVIEDCVNDASAHLNTGTVDYGYFGGVIGFIDAASTSTIPYPVIIDCVNNGDLTINNQRTEIAISGICGADAGGTTAHFIRCTNNGDIIVEGNAMPATTGAYGEISGICSYTNANFYACYNNGSLVGNAKYIGGLVGRSSSNADLGALINCGNTGYLHSDYSDSNGAAVIGDLFGYISSGVGVKVQGSEINTLNIHPYKIILENAGSSVGTLIVPKYTGIISVTGSLGFNSIDLSKVDEKLVLNVNNASFTLLGNDSDISFTINGTNNTVTVGSSTVLGDIRLEGAGNKCVNNGTIGHLAIKDSSVESVNNATISSVEFIGSDYLSMAFTNNGVISNGSEEKWHTVQTQNPINLLFTNNGEIHGVGTKYALLFYGLSNVTFIATPESSLVIENENYTAIFYNSETMRANSVLFNIEEGASGVSNDSYYGISTHQTGATSVTVNIITQVEVNLTWRSAMPNNDNRAVGQPWNSFYPGADGYTCSTYGVDYDSTRHYILKIEDDYDDSIAFTLTIVFYNTQTGLITEIKSPTNLYDLYGGYPLSHGQSLVFEASSAESDGFYITGFCGTKHSSGTDPLHQEHVTTFQNNIKLYSERNSGQ